LEAEGLRLLPVPSLREVAGAIPVISRRFVQVKEARRDVERELKRLRKAEQMALSDPEIMGGTPVFRGTRIPVELVAAMSAQGTTTEEILQGYPALRREHEELAPALRRRLPKAGTSGSPAMANDEPTRVTRVSAR
jgi:uncharacterized protein (DUF433 family)